MPAAGDGALGEGRRRADIQGLRAVAVLMIIGFHASLGGAQNPGGGTFTGVDVFFVISGFVITSALLRREPATIRSELADFYARRARRILPALALMITVVAALGVVLLSPLGTQQQAARTGGAASVFAANVQLYRVGTGYFALPAHTNPFLHTWSLAVEEQFYLLFPAVVFVSWALAHRYRDRLRASPRQVLGVVLGVGVVASFLASLHYSTSNPPFAFYSSPTRAWEFGTGALLSLLGPALRHRPRPLGAGLGLAGVSLLVLTVTSVTPGSDFPGTAALLPVGGAALLLGAGTVATTGASVVLATPPLRWLGDRSYSWYLWHWPLIVFARVLWPAATWELLVVGLASILPAAVSYGYVENPIRFDRGLVGRRAAALAAVCVVVPLAACGGLELAAHLAFRTGDAQSVVRDVLAPHADLQRGCDNRLALGDRHQPVCTWRSSHPRGDVYLVGDSNAGQFTEPVVAGATRDGFNATVATASSCPFVDLVVSSAPVAPAGSPFASLGCHELVTRSVATLVQRHPSLVVIASSTTDYINRDTFELEDPSTGATASSPASKAHLWVSGLASVLRPLDRAGIPVVVVHVIPHIPAFDPQQCPAVRLFLDPSDCGATVARAEADQQRRRSIVAEDRALASAPSAIGVDFEDQLCGPSSCAARRGNVWVYRNGNHLSVPGARMLDDSFATVIDARAGGR